MISEQNFYNLEIDEVLDRLQSSKQGLSEAEAAHRLKQHGPNQLLSRGEPLWKRLVEPFSSVFVVVLLIALVLSLVEGRRVDAIIVAIIVGLNAGIYYAQEYSVGRVLKSLKKHDVSMVKVLRDGQTTRLNSELLAYGDIVHVEEGMKVPADGRLIEAELVEVDEALLTGESLPVHKHAHRLNGERPLYNQHNMLFKGTYIKTGSGLMVVTGIGNQTELGEITALAAKADLARSPIEHKIDSFAKKLIVVILAAAGAALLLAVWRGIALEEALRFSLVVTVSAVPEGLPVALTIVLLLSARRMAKAHALVKKISSIETMGAITLIATDKTGTITENRLTVADKHTTHSSRESFNTIIRASLNGDEDHGSDPLDDILLSSVRRIAMPSSWHKVKEFPFNQELLLSAALWQHPKGYTLFIKGAPERILHHCSAHHRRDAEVAEALGDFTGRGYRTIAFAHKDFKLPLENLDHRALSNMSFDGFVGLSDTLRPRIASAVAAARLAGIKVIMLTGDHVATAGFIARQVGIAATSAEVSDSRVLANGDPEDIRSWLKQVKVFGRVLPEHKYALLQATKGHEITAMTGDGVNDIPALVEADAGIAMGSGTDAAKDASDIVLLDNNFHTIIAAMRVGRTALANIRKMLVYLLGTSSGEVLTLLFALILGIPLPVAAIQILWINLVTDGVAVIPLGLSPPESRHTQEPPRSPQAPLLNLAQITRIMTIATVMSLSVLWVYSLNLDHGQHYAQTLAFLSLIVVQWANALNVNFEYRSWLHNLVQPNWKLLAAIGFSVVLQIAVFMTPLGKFLEVTPVMWRDALIAVIVPAAASLIAVDLHKLAWRLLVRS